MRIRLALLICALGAAAALGVALGSERYGRLVPCAFCLVERWPYRIAAVLALGGILLPARLGRVVLALCVLVLLAAMVAGMVHVGVEFKWWPSPLPECMAPSLSGMSAAERLAHMPARPSKPCDEPTFLIAWLPVSMAAMNVIYAAVLAAVLTTLFRSSKGARA